MRALLVLTALPLILWGCGSGPSTAPPPPAESPEQLVAQWTALATAGKDNLDIQKASEIVNKLAAQGPDKLLPLLDVLANKDADPYEKVMVVMTAMPFVSQFHEPKLIELTGEQNDSVSRADAAHLLGSLQQRRLGTPEGLSRLRDLMADPDRHVRSATILVMELAGDPEALTKAVELWSSPDATPQERNSIVLNMPQLAVMENTKLFAEAVLDTGLPTDSRKRAIQDLGMVGDASVLDALRKCAETETDPVLKEMAKTAAEAVDARVKQGLVAVPVNSKDLPPPPPGAVPADTAAAPAPAAGT
jgi:hypothetical protein